MRGFRLAYGSWKMIWQLAAIAIHVALPQTGELHVVVIHLPAAGFEQTQDEPPSGRLATAALPHQPERLPRHDLEVHAVNGFNFPHQPRAHDPFDDGEVFGKTLDRQ